MTKPTDSKPSSSATQTGVDVTSPYFLHASDSPGDRYVVELLNDGNYADWASEMSNALYAKNKIGFVDGTIPILDPSSADYMSWKRCNAMVRGWLSIAMEKEIKDSVKHAKTAREIWQDLEERFGSESAPRAYEIKCALSNTRQGNLSFLAYYTKLKSFCDSMQSASPLSKCSCGGCNCDVTKQLTAMKEKEHMYEFLMRLDESFSVIRTQILSTRPTPTLGTAYHLASEDEKHRQISTVNVLSQFVQEPKKSHADAANRILRYLKSSPGQGILLPSNDSFTLEAFCDADLGGCPLTRRSRTGYSIKLGGAPISWRTKKQTVVSRSSAEAEYRAMAATVSEIIWLRWLLLDFEVMQKATTPLYCDNQAARHIANNPVYHERTKHVEMDCYFVRERMESREIEPRCISTSMQVADLFTKPLGADKLRFLLGKLGIHDVHAPP